MEKSRQLRLVKLAIGADSAAQVNAKWLYCLNGLPDVLSIQAAGEKNRSPGLFHNPAAK